MAKEIEIRKKTVVLEDGSELIDITPVKIIVSEPTVPESYKLTQEDVWGKYDKTHKLISKGMIVSRTGDKCAIFGDILGSKDITVVCTLDQEFDVQYWLEYVHGADCISKRKEIGNNKLAIRSEYRCW